MTKFFNKIETNRMMMVYLMNQDLKPTHLGLDRIKK